MVFLVYYKDSSKYRPFSSVPYKTLFWVTKLLCSLAIKSRSIERLGRVPLGYSGSVESLPFHYGHFKEELFSQNMYGDQPHE